MEFYGHHIWDKKVSQSTSWFDTCDTNISVEYLAGTAIVDIIRGKAEPTGKLPLTFYTEAWLMNMHSPLQNMNLDSHLGRTYRYIRDGTYVKHSFGYGLTYTTWRYSNFICEECGQHVCCEVKLHNTGDRAGYQVTQIYVRLPALESARDIRARKSKTQLHWHYDHQYSLVSFRKTFVKGGSSRIVSLRVRAKSLTIPTLQGTRIKMVGKVVLVVGGRLPSDTEAVEQTGECQVCTLVLGQEASYKRQE